MARHRELWISLISVVLFLAAVQWKGPYRAAPQPPQDHVVIPAPVQMLLYGGDRYLAADIEMIRAAALGAGVHETDLRYLIRTHEVVAQLNPCHEDAYYQGNALLSWGGAEPEGSELLRRAMACRTWDEFPAFFYAINQYFFNRDNAETRRALAIAAERSENNAAVFRKLSIMIAAEELDNERLALDYLRQQHDTADSPKLKQMLERRVVRLEGLLALRNAQQRYEQQFNRPLERTEQLLQSGILEALPQDPLKLGYRFSQGRFTLRNRTIKGLERKQ